MAAGQPAERAGSGAAGSGVAGGGGAAGGAAAGRPAARHRADFVSLCDFFASGIFLVQSLETAKVNYSECAVHRAWSEVDFRRCKSRLLHFLGRTSALSHFGSFA